MNNIKAALLIISVTLITMFTSWFVVPFFNSAFASVMIYLFPNIEYWNTRLLLDIINTFFVFLIGSYIVIKKTKKNPILVSLPVGLSGLAAFYFELGGLECLGVCGAPLWYDIASLVKHVLASITIGFILFYKQQEWRSRSIFTNI